MMQPMDAETAYAAHRARFAPPEPCVDDLHLACNELRAWMRANPSLTESEASETLLQIQAYEAIIHRIEHETEPGFS